MTNEPEVKSENSISGLFKSVVEPSVLLTLAVAGTYFVGWIRTSSYFYRIGLNHLSLNLATSYYLQKGFTTMAFIGWLIFALYLYSRKPRSALKMVLLNLMFWFFLAYLSLAPFFVVRHKFDGMILIGLLLFLPLTYGTYLNIKNNESTLFIIRTENIKVQLFMSLILLIYLYNFARMVGELEGSNAFTGANPETTEIKFQWKGTPPPSLENKQLYLILYANDKYYCVENYSLNRSQVYEISKDIVDSAITIPVNN